MFYGLQKGKGESKAFHPPSPPYNVVPLFQLPTEGNKDNNKDNEDGVVWGRVSIFVSLKLPYLSSMSQQLFCR